MLKAAVINLPTRAANCFCVARMDKLASMQKTPIYKGDMSWLASSTVGRQQRYPILFYEAAVIDPALRAEQAKQKFWSLRVDPDLNDQSACALLQEAGRTLIKAWEPSGAPRVPRQARGYCRTLCDVHLDRSQMATDAPTVFQIAIILKKDAEA